MSDHAAEICQTLRHVTDDDRGSVRRAAGRVRTAVLALVVCVVVLALGAGSAQALLVHTFSFGTAGPGAGQFKSPQGVAVDQSSGDVYVVDAGNFRVEKFTAAGTFVVAFGKGVDATSPGNVCTASSGDTCQAGTQGTSAGALDSPLFIAVDNSGGPSAGDVYVGDRGDETISKFDSSGNLITSWATGGQMTGFGGTIDGITIDPSGNLFVINDGNTLYEFAQDGTAVTNFPTLRGMTPAGLDVNNSGILYKVNGDTSVERVNPASGPSFPDLQVTPSGTTGLVIDRSSGDLYQDTGSSVSHYVFDASGNVVETGGTTCVIPPGACPATDTFGSGVLSSGTGIGFDSAGTTAYVADAGNNDVAVFGPPSPGKPVIDSESASNINQHTATVNAEVNPFGVDTNSCQFQYVDATDFANGGFANAATVTVPCTPADLGSTFSDQLASANVTGLTLGTTYDFRVVATNADGTTNGNPATFMTLGAALVDSESATNIAATAATLNTQINPLGTDTTCAFQYVDDADFTGGGGFSSPATVTVPCTPADLGAGTTDATAAANITGLNANTLYDFRAVATNSLGTVDGNATQFTTAPPLLIDAESATNITSTAATLNTAINPEGLDTTCQFQYVADAAFQATGYTTATTVACSPSDLGSGTTDATASANIMNLTPNTLYHFRAVGNNSLGTLNGGDTTFMTLPPVAIDSESVTGVTNTSATIKAEINPEGTDTTYQFQYVTDATFAADGNSFSGATTVPQNPIDIGSSTTDQSAHVDLTGLQAGTKYHFRVVATNTLTTLDGNDRTFTTLASVGAAGLPDSRAYEMVSPVKKADGEVLTLAIIGGDQAAPDGNSVGFLSFTALPGSVAPGLNFIATRGATGWSTQSLMPPQAPGSTLELPGYGKLSTDLSKGVLSNGGGTVGGVDGQDFPALAPGSCTTALFPTPPPKPTTPCTGEPMGFQNLFVRDNSKGSFQLVNSYANSPSGETPATANLQGGSADLSTVVFDESAALTTSAPLGQDSLYAWNGGTVTLLGTGATLGASSRVLHAVSDNGSRIFFTDASGHLNLFQNGTATQVDKPQGGSGPGGGGQFMTAASDGSVVFFTDSDSAGLTSDTVSGSGANLYEYTGGTGGTPKLTNLTANATSATVDGVLGASADGSYVYFVAEGVLPNTSGAAPGQENLYVDHNGTPTFIAKLSGSDSSDWNSQLTSRVTPDGTHLAFDSVQSLTGFDNTDANSGSADTEIFLYTATTKSLVCASCNPAGTQPVGSSQLDPVEGGLLSGGNQYLQHNLSDDGSRLFFDSNDALSPRDTNGKQDVYEYENGQPHLISTGTSADNSTFLDASSTGSDVFFITRDQLVPQDTDGANDVYDARVNGGFPAPSPNPPCSGEACKPATTPPPSVPTLATISFVGPGNPTPGAPPPPTTTPKVKVSAKVLKGFKFSVNVRVPGKGKLTISGSGLQTVKKSVGKAGSFTLTVGLTSKERSKLKKEHKLKLKITVHVGFTSASGKSSSATFSVTVKA